MQLIIAAFVEGFLSQHRIELHSLANIRDISDLLQCVLHYQILLVDFFPLLSLKHYAPPYCMLGANQAIVGRPRLPSFKFRHSMPLSFASASRTSPRLRLSMFANAPTLRVIWLSVMPASPAVSILVKTALQQASKGPSAILALNILMVSVA